MPPIREVQAREVQDRAPVIEVLCDGFYDNPLLAWIFPDPDTRLEALREWFELWLGVYGDEALLFLTEDAGAAALWAVPNASGLDGDSMPAFVAMIERWNGDRTGLVLQGLGAIGEHPDQPFWYLNSIAARRGQRASGLGAQLLVPMLERADREGLPVYLESSNPRNLTFYDRHGFEHWGPRLEMPEGDAPVQRMWRPART
jgi:GNAT superfamily N-acetyltransferase